MIKKKTLIEEVFSRAANHYDIMNDIMSFGIHRLWKIELIKKALNCSPNSYLDLATGSGDIAFGLIKSALAINNLPNDIILSDQNLNMLNMAKERFINNNLVRYIKDFSLCSSESLPFEDARFDCVTVAFGVRNFSDIKLCLKEIRRVLKPGARFFCLEFSPQLNNKQLQKIYDLYSSIIPTIGSLVTRDRGSYQYLVDSIKSFPSKQDFADLIRDAGFYFVDWTELSFGVCNIHTAVNVVNVSNKQA